MPQHATPGVQSPDTAESPMRALPAIAASTLLAGCFTLPAPIVLPAPGTPTPANGTAVDATVARPDGETRPTARRLDAVDPILVQIAHAAAAVHQQRCRVAIENLANVDTCGWKRRMVRTSTQPIHDCSGTPHTLPVLLGTESVFTPGALHLTGRNLDLAIDGDGFFAVTLRDGSTGYTRAGCMQVDAAGKLRSGDGDVLLPEITLPSDTLEIAIDPEGRVAVRTACSPDPSTRLGQLHLHRFVNPSGLLVAGAVWRPTEASGPPITNRPGWNGLGWIKQGCLERSNVDGNREAMELQFAERQFAALQDAMRRLGVVVP